MIVSFTLFFSPSSYDCPLRVKEVEKTLCEPKETLEACESNRPRYYKVLISGLPFNATVETVLEFINDSSREQLKVNKSDIRLVMFDDNAQKCKGLAFITAFSNKAYSRLLSFNGKLMGGRVLSVEKVVDKKKNATIPPELDCKLHVGEKRCYRCGEFHDPKACTNERLCYKCKGNDHISSQCPKKASKTLTQT